jgi:murein L,D-transpeptidase YafK
MTLPSGRVVSFGLMCSAAALLTGCDESSYLEGPSRSEHPISSATLAEMVKIDTTPSSPMLVRAYKKEAELEIWKMKSDGRYALLKTYPICRWSGQLGPKKRQGDMQVPEGFYTIAPGQMNPNSHYYLAFNVGYPNAYDRALGRTGGSVMVHGVCSSAGCFSMTDEQIDDIYAIAREAFRGGQREIQMQSYPFHMTAENIAKYRLDPNIDFWKEIKVGADHFEVAKTEPSVLVCGQHYEFDATPMGPVSAGAPCPALQRDESIEAAVAEKEDKDDAKAAELVASGVKPIRTVYADGGQNPFFAGYKDASDPDALVSGAQEIVLEDRVKPPWAATAADAAGLHTENDQPVAAQATAQIADSPDAPAAPEPPSAQ